MQKKITRMLIALTIGLLVKQLQLGGQLLVFIATLFHAIMFILLIVSIVGMVLLPLLAQLASNNAVAMIFQFGDAYALPVFVVIAYLVVSYLIDKIILFRKANQLSQKRYTVPQLMPPYLAPAITNPQAKAPYIMVDDMKRKTSYTKKNLPHHQQDGQQKILYLKITSSH